MTESPHANTPGSDRDTRTSGAGSSRESALTMGSITKTFRSGHLGNRTVTDALRDVSIEVSGGQVMGLVGESGSGKSTLGRIALGLTSPTAGTVQCVGKEITELHSGELRRHRRRMQMIFQDSGSAFNPRMTLEDLLVEPLKVQGIDSPADRRRKASKIADEVGLRSEWMGRLPHEFSGGQRQRIAIARALAPRPEVLVADEPVSALDVSVRAQIVELLARLKEQFGMTLVMVSHDIAIVGQLCEEMVILRDGRIEETGPTPRVLTAPRAAYTRRLLEAVPRLP